MASPFAAFRKYQALLLAVFGVMIIVVFTIGDSVSRLAGDANGMTDDVVVKWDGTQLKQSRLAALLSGRQVILYGLTKVQDSAFRKEAFPQFQQQMAFAQRFSPGASLPRPRMIFTESDMSPEGTVRTMVLAQRARDLGIKIPDSQIIQYLTDLTDGKLNYSEIYEILVGGKDAKYKQSIKSVFSVLREEMLANKVFEEFFRGTVAMPAAQQLDYYARVNRQVQADVVSIPVDQFVDQVADPSEKTLQAYFDKYKHQTPPFDYIGGVAYESPEPGFKLPHRVSVEYVKVNSDELLDIVRDRVAEEEIVAYYDENKQRDEHMHAPDDLLLPNEEAPTGDDAKPDGGGDDDSKGADTTGAAGDAPAGNAAENENSGIDKAASGDGGEPCSGGEADADAPNEVSDAIGDGAEAGTDEAGATEPVADDIAPFEKTNAEETDAEETVAEESDAAEKGAAQPATEPGSAADSLTGGAGEPQPGGAGSGEADSTEAATNGKGADSEADKEIPKAINYKPLDEVREYIRQKIAQEKATASIDEKFAAMRKRMDSYYKAKRYTEDDEVPSIKPPDFKQLAEKNGLKSQAIELKSEWYYQRETDIGKSFQQEPPTRFNPYGAQLHFHELVFRLGEQSWFVSKETRDDEGYRYLAWKVGERDAEVPELEGSVRDDVVRAWKTGAGLDDDSDKARGLARKRADDMARQVRDGKAMADVAVEQKGSRAIETEAFSWLTQGNAAPANMFAPQPLRLSEIDEIDQPGVEFMRTTFGLGIDSLGVAMNHPKSHVHVIRPTFENKSAGVLQEEFLSKMDDRFVAQQITSAAQLDWRLLSQEWFDEIDRDMNVVWLKPEVRNSR